MFKYKQMLFLEVSMEFAQEILNTVSAPEDIKLMCEFHAQKVKFHSTYTEYFFKDGSSLIQEG